MPAIPATMVCLRLARVDAAQQRHVDLQQVGLIFGKKLEAGIAGAEIVERGDEAEPPVFGDDAFDMSGVVDALVLGEFEHDALGREADAARGLERGADARGRFVDRIGHEIDRQPQVLVVEQPARGLDRLDAAEPGRSGSGCRSVTLSRTLAADSPFGPRTSAS